MFDAFSSRSRIVVFGARFAAGERGSTAIDTEDLLISLIREDQGMNGAMLTKLAGGKEAATSLLPAPTHKQFFDPTIVAALLSSIEESVPCLEPIATWAEIPLSAGLARVFEAGEVYRGQFHYHEIEPLHLPAAVFDEDGGLAGRELSKMGITQEEVFERLRT